MSEYVHLQLTGTQLCLLMRQHKRTIAQLARDNGITQARVRQVRAEGVSGFLASEWHYFVTGQWLDSKGIAAAGNDH